MIWTVILCVFVFGAPIAFMTYCMALRKMYEEFDRCRCLWRARKM